MTRQCPETELKNRYWTRIFSHRESRARDVLSAHWQGWYISMTDSVYRMKYMEMRKRRSP